MSVKSKEQCSNCQSTNIGLSDFETYQRVCLNCGTNVDDIYTVQDTLVRGGADGMERRGVTIDVKAGFMPYMGAGPALGICLDSRQQAAVEAKRRFKEIASSIGPAVDQTHVTARALAIWKMCFQRKLTRGYPKQLMAAVCLYISCRDDESGIPYMLIDFAIACDVNMFRLSRAFYRVCRDLPYHLTILSDPTIFVERFVCELKLGDPKTSQKIATTACRLVARMKRDSIHTGRHPAGVCGACIVLAARMHGHPLAVKEVVRVVKLTERTIRLRLTEFLRTPAAGFTVEEFHQEGIENTEKWKKSADPPSFTRARIKRKKKEKEMIKKAKEEKSSAGDESVSEEKELVPPDTDNAFDPLNNTIYDESNDPYWTNDQDFLDSCSDELENLSCEGDDLENEMQVFQTELDMYDEFPEEETGTQCLPFTLNEQTREAVPEPIETEDAPLCSDDDCAEVEREILPPEQVKLREQQFDLMNPDYEDRRKRQIERDKDKIEREKRRVRKRAFEGGPSEEIGRKVRKLFPGSSRANHDIVKRLLAGESLTNHTVNIDDEIEVTARKVEPPDDVIMTEPPPTKETFNPLELYR